MVYLRLLSMPASSRTNNENLNRFCIAVMGSANVGKSMVINGYLNLEYPEIFASDEGTTFRVKKQEHDIDIIESKYVHAFAMYEKVISQAHAFVLVYSVDSMASFDYITALHHHIVDMKGDDVQIVVIGNTKETDRRDVIREVAECVVTIDWENTYHELSALRDIYKIFKVFYGLLCDANVLTPCNQRATSVPSVDTQARPNIVYETSTPLANGMTRSVSFRGFRRVREFLRRSIKR